MSNSDRSKYFFRPLVWGGLAFILVFLLRWALQGRQSENQPLRPERSTQIAEIFPTATQVVITVKAALPTQALPTLPQVAPTGIQTPAPTPIEPLLTSAGFGFASWLPQGDWLAFLAMTGEDVFNRPACEGYCGPPPGTVHFYNARTDEQCQYAMDNPYGMDFYRWFLPLADGRLAVLTKAGQLVALDSPCAPDTARVMHEFPEPVADVLGNNAGHTILYLQVAARCYFYNLTSAAVIPFEPCARFATFSPDSSFLAVPGEEFLNDADTLETVTVVEVATGKVEGSITRPLSDRGIGSLAGPTWLDGGHFLIDRSDEGPLIVTVASPLEVLPVAPTFFQVPGASHQYASVNGELDSGRFHVLFNDRTTEGGKYTIRLYHGEDGSLEVLTFSYAYFTGDGNHLDLWQSVDVGGDEQYRRFERPIDPPGNSIMVESKAESGQEGLQSPDGSLEIMLDESQLYVQTTVTLRSLPGHTAHQTWVVEAFDATPARAFYGSAFDSSPWSPGNRYVVLTGAVLQDEQGLFLLPIEKP